MRRKSSSKKQNEFYALVKIPKSAKLNYMEIMGRLSEHSRSAPKVKESEDGLIIEINAKDLAALRSTFNAATRDVQVVENTSSSVSIDP